MRFIKLSLLTLIMGLILPSTAEVYVAQAREKNVEASKKRGAHKKKPLVSKRRSSIHKKAAAEPRKRHVSPRHQGVGKKGAYGAVESPSNDSSLVDPLSLAALGPEVASMDSGVTPKGPVIPINEALASAYMTNSALKAAVYQQFATQEGIDIAFSGFRPSLSVSGNAARRVTETNAAPRAGQEIPTSKYYDTPYGATAQVTQNLYQGGGTIAAVSSAKRAVEAGHYGLRNTEVTTLLNAASAYLNIIYTRSAIQYNKENVKFLTESLKSIKAQVEVGEKTMTDVAQAESALAQGLAGLSTAEGNYQNAVANYINIVGQKPGNFVYPPSLKNLPPTRGELIQDALQNNPLVLQAEYAFLKAKSDVRVQEAKLLPQVNFTGQLARNLDKYSTSTSQTNTGSATLQLSVPIYQQGAEWATVRQSVDSEGQARSQWTQARKTAEQNAVTAWDNWVVAKANTEYYSKQVEYATLFRDGAVLEEQVGERDYLDVLQAQSQLLQAQTGLEQAKMNERVAEYQIYSTMGILTAEYLDLPVRKFAEKEHLEVVKYKPFGFGTPPLRDGKIR